MPLLTRCVLVEGFLESSKKEGDGAGDAPICGSRDGLMISSMAVEDVVLPSVRSLVKMSFGCKIFSMSSSFKLGKDSIREASLMFDSLVAPVFAILFMAPIMQLFCPLNSILIRSHTIVIHTYLFAFLCPTATDAWLPSGKKSLKNFSYLVFAVAKILWCVGLHLLQQLSLTDNVCFKATIWH